MAKAKSVHDKLKKTRKSRTHISFEVEVDDKKEKKELPFVAGVMGDFAGDTKDKAFKERQFAQIEKENFDDVMEKINPTLNLKVENTLADDDSEMSVNLKFHSMKDFEPGQVAQQVESLKKLLETRDQLTDLLSKADLSEDLEGLLGDILQNTDDLKQVAGELGIDDKKASKKEGDDK